MDKRKALEPGSMLEVYKEKQETGCAVRFLMGRETGRGGSCIVYDASYEDSVGSRHLVRLKECCPYGIDFLRDTGGRLCPAAGQRRVFEERQKLFIMAYKKQVEIRQETGLSNITVGTFQLYYGNGTVYSVMDCSEGEDYRKTGQESIKETLQRIRAVAFALWKYHQAGYLHLDIKPENVWLIPETRELVQLFDFDSVIKKKDLAGMPGNLLSFTEGFAAPELTARNVKQIGQVTDIYGVGALLFYRLMGKCPGRQEREYKAAYDFSELTEENKLVRPLFFGKLEAFFHKTLAAAGELRFQSMEETINALERLTELADTDTVFAISNFSYHQNCFVGRDRELNEIEERLSRKHLLFLHGIGGIGKTELAIRYAYENEKTYGTILMLRVGWSLEESLCRDDIALSNFKREETEDNLSYAKRKLSALKACLTEHDLLILDNFDQEDDPMLEEFLELRCHILITSRCDFSDWNYPQMEVNELEHMEELMALFENFNRLPYSEDEMDAVRELIRRVESHTMLTELMAKNLRVSGVAPSALLEKMRQEAGTANMEKEPVRHRKDNVRRQAAVQGHLKRLFDISGLNEMELSLLDNLSLFAGMRIKTEIFLEWSGAMEGGKNQTQWDQSQNRNGENRKEADWKEALECLVRRGWIEGKGEEDKISLHQIVLDLIYEDRKPGGKSCKVLVGFLTEYAAQKPENRTEREIRNRLCEIVGNRLQGRDPETLAFYLTFCENIRYQEQWMAVCLEEYEKRKEIFQNQLARVYRLMGNQEINRLDSVECVLDETLQQTTAEQAISYFRKAIRDKEEMAEPADYGKFLYYIGKFCSSSIETGMIEVPAAVTVYSFSLECMEKGTAIYEAQKERDKRLLTEMYDSLMDFYDPQAFCLIRPEYFGNLEKRLFYAHKREEICPSKEIDAQGNVIYSIDIHQLSYTDAGEEAEREGNLEEAVRYYELAADRQEEDLIGCQDRIGYLYEKMGEYEKALAFFEEKYKEEENRVENGDRALCIGRLYKKIGQYEKAYAFIQESKAFFKGKIEQDPENGFWKGRLIQACQELAEFSSEDISAAVKWEEGLEFYRQEREAVKLERSVLDFQMWWAERFMEMDKKEKDLAGVSSSAGKVVQWPDVDGKPEKLETGGTNGGEKAAWRPDDRSYLELAVEMLRDAGQNCLENYISSGEMGRILELAEGIEDEDRILPYALKTEFLTVCGELAHELEGGGNEKEQYFYETALKLLIEEKQGETIQAMLIRWKLVQLCSYLGDHRKSVDYLSQCDYEIIAEFRIEEMKKENTYDEMRLMQEMMEVWKEGGDIYGEATDSDGEDRRMYGEVADFDREERDKYGEAVDSDRERKEQDGYRYKFLQQAIRCYRQAADVWYQMEDSAKEKYLYYFGRVMGNLASLRKQEERQEETYEIKVRQTEAQTHQIKVRQTEAQTHQIKVRQTEAQTHQIKVRQVKAQQTKVQQTITAWHREVLRMPGKEEQGLYNIMYELNCLAEVYENQGDIDGAIICLLERGIAGLEIGNNSSEAEHDIRTDQSTLERWQDIWRTEYDYDESEAKITRIAETFFKKTECRITKEQTDMVLETCRDILKLCSKKKRQGLQEACRETVKRFGEERISFK